MSYVSPIKIGYEAEPEEGWTDKIGRYMAGEVDNLVLQSCVKVGCHVDKDELEKALRYDRDQYVKGYEDGKRDAAAAIEALLPKRGKWVRVEDGDSWHYECSRCRERPLYSLYGDIVLSGTCPFCGAKMEVQE